MLSSKKLPLIARVSFIPNESRNHSRLLMNSIIDIVSLRARAFSYSSRISFNSVTILPFILSGVLFNLSIVSCDSLNFSTSPVSGFNLSLVENPLGLSVLAFSFDGLLAGSSLLPSINIGFNNFSALAISDPAATPLGDLSSVLRSASLTLLPTITESLLTSILVISFNPT